MSFITPSVVGAVLILFGYFMLSTGRWTPNYRYHTTNLVASLIFGYMSFLYQDLGFVLLNGATVCIALYAIGKLAYGTYKQRMGHRTTPPVSERTIHTASN